MREAAYARIEGGLQLIVSRIRVPGGHDDAGLGQCADDRGRRAFGRQRHHGYAAVRRGQQLHRILIEAAQFAGIVHTAAFVAEERTFDVDAEHAGHAARDGFAHRVNRLLHDVQIVADQRGQKSRGPETAMSTANGGDGLDARVAIEQHAAAAVHLRVDESGHQQLPVEIDGVIGADDLARIDDGLDASGANQQSSAALDAGVGQQLSVLEGQQHQTVSVTLLRCGGRSGSRPRASASALAMA